MTNKNKIEFRYFTQEDLLQAGYLDMQMPISTAETTMVTFRANKILFPDKIVHIFNDDAQKSIY